MTIEDKIQQLTTLKQSWEIQLRHDTNDVMREIDQDIVDSLSTAIDIMNKYQNIENEVHAIYYNVTKEDERYVNEYLGNIMEILEDENVRQ